MLRSESLKTLSSFALLFCVVVACKEVSSPGNTTTLKSPDGKFQLTVPDGWVDAPDLNDKAKIKAANKRGDMYVIVMTESKADLDMSLDKFTDTTRDAMITRIAATDPAKPESITVNGNEARQYELRGTIDKTTKVVYLIATVETPENFHQIVTWTMPSKYDENKAVLKKVIDSFRAVPASGSDSNTNSSH